MSPRVFPATQAYLDIAARHGLNPCQMAIAFTQTRPFATIPIVGATSLAQLAVNIAPITLSDGTPDWYGLGPVSVLPAYQRQGIGKALIHEGLERLKAMHARGCCLVGHPGYYTKFGFQNVPGLALEGVQPEVFFTLSLDGHVPQGTVNFHPAFLATA